MLVRIYSQSLSWGKFCAQRSEENVAKPLLRFSDSKYLLQISHCTLTILQSALIKA